MTLYVRQQKRHRYKELTFRLCGRRWRWDDLREEHWNMYITKGETDHQSRFDAWDKVLGPVHWDDPEGWDGERRWEGDSGWGTHVYLWLIHVNLWPKPLQYCKVISLQLKLINKILKEKKKNLFLESIYLKVCFASFPRAQSTSFLIPSLNSFQMLNISKYSSQWLDPFRAEWWVTFTDYQKHSGILRRERSRNLSKVPNTGHPSETSAASLSSPGPGSRHRGPLVLPY